MSSGPLLHWGLTTENPCTLFDSLSRKSRMMSASSGAMPSSSARFFHVALTTSSRLRSTIFMPACCLRALRNFTAFMRAQCTEDDLIGIVDGCADLGEGGGGGRHCEDRRGKIKDGRIINVSASVLHLTSSISSVHSLPKPTVRHHDRYHRLDHRDHTGNDARIVTTFLRYLTDGRSWLDADIQNQVFSS